MIVEVAASGEGPDPEWDAAVERWELPRFWLSDAIASTVRAWSIPVITARLLDAGETVALACYRPHILAARPAGGGPLGTVAGSVRRALLQRTWLCWPPVSFDPGLAWAPGMTVEMRRRFRPLLQRQAMKLAPRGPKLVGYPALSRQALAEHLTIPASVRMTPGWVFDVEWSSIDDYLRILPRKRRYKFRRLLRDTEAGDLRRCDPASGPTITGAAFAEVETMVRQRYLPPGYEALPFPADYLDIIRRPGHTGVFGYVDADDRPLRANLGLVGGGKVLSCTKSGGHDPSEADGLYYVVIIDQLRWAIETGMEQLTIGAGADAAKRHFGARAAPWYLALHPQP